MKIASVLSRAISLRLATTASIAIFALTSGSAMAAVVCGPTSNITVPDNIDGVYINFVTGATGTSSGDVPDWDFNPYNGSAGLSFFWATGAGGVATAATGGEYVVLAAGAPVSAASIFTNIGSTAAMVQFKAGVTGGFLGVRFTNEATGGAINYGWVRVNTTSPTGFPMTIVDYCYQNDGTQIITGTTPVALQNFSVE